MNKSYSRNNLFSLSEDKTDLPLTIKVVPKSFDEILGQEHILRKDSVFRTILEEDSFTSLIFYGPSGTGKTALAKLIASKTQSKVIQANATTIGIPELRSIIKEVNYYNKVSNKRTLIILDEIHHFNRYQQDVLLPEIEANNIRLIGITTENPYYYVNSALISRSIVLEFKKLSDEVISFLINKILLNFEFGSKKHEFKIEQEALQRIVNYANGDMRKAINLIDIITKHILVKDKQRLISYQLVSEFIQMVSLSYDKKSYLHYDHASAFIKSVRGSDPDAALYWMLKMLESGEDPRFIVRRLIILASEDIGNADPFALVLATSALQAVEFVGMPEAKIILGQVTTYFACAEKSNAAYEAVLKAEEEVKTKVSQEVPNHLKNRLNDEYSNSDLKYQYPHDFDGSFVAQKYLQNNKIFYEPKQIGKEAIIKERLAKWRKILREKNII